MNVKDIDLNIGEDFGIVYAVQNDNVDLTGFKSVFAIRKRASGPLVIKVQRVASGKIATFNISGKDTLELSPLVSMCMMLLHIRNRSLADITNWVWG